MRTPPVIARAAILCGLAGAAWCALATLDPDTARADERPATATEQPGGLLGTVRDVVDQVLPTPSAKPEPEPEPAESESSNEAPARDDPGEQADEQDDSGDATEESAPDEEATPEPRDNPPAQGPVIQLPSIEVPVDLPVVPPITVVTPPIVIEVPDPRPATPAADPVPSQPPAPIVVTLPIIGPTTQPAATPTPAAQVDLAPSTTDEVGDGDTSSDVAAEADASSDAAELAPDGLPVTFGPVLGRTLDDGIRPSEPAKPAARTGECGQHERTLEDVRRVSALATGDQRRAASNAADPTARPCPGAPLGPDTDVSAMAAVHSPSTSGSDPVVGDTPRTLTWPMLARLIQVRPRSTIPVGLSTHLDPRPA